MRSMLSVFLSKGGRRRPIHFAVLFTMMFGPGLAFAQPTLGTGRAYFTVNGTPKFLTFFSYFAALRPTNSAYGAVLTQPQIDAHLAEVSGHFDLLKSAGFDGVRIFPNWAWSLKTIITGCDVPDPNTLMKSAAGPSVPSPIPSKPNTTWLNTQQLSLLHQVLTRADQKGLIVEVAWNNEQVRSIVGQNVVVDRLTAQEYPLALQEVITQFAGLHPHMFYDLQNEYNYGIASPPNNNCPKDGVPGAQAIQPYIPTYKALDSGRKFTLSYTAPPGQTQHQTTVNWSYLLGIDLVTYHDPRDYNGSTPTWPGQTANHVSWLRQWVEYDTGTVPNGPRPAAQWKPVFLNEPDRWLAAPAVQNALTGNHFITAVKGAKSAGAAGWTFHTEALFRDATISSSNGQYNITGSVAPGLSGPSQPEWDFINGFNAQLTQTVWGIPRLAGSWDAPADNATVPHTFTTSGWVLDQTAQDALATSVRFWASATPNTKQVFLGDAVRVARPDVAGAYGASFLNAGFSATLTAPVPGTYYLVIEIVQAVNGQSLLVSKLLTFQ